MEGAGARPLVVCTPCSLGKREAHDHEAFEERYKMRMAEKMKEMALGHATQTGNGTRIMQTSPYSAGQIDAMREPISKRKKKNTTKTKK